MSEVFNVEVQFLLQSSTEIDHECESFLKWSFYVFRVGGFQLSRHHSYHHKPHDAIPSPRYWRAGDALRIQSQFQSVISIWRNTCGTMFISCCNWHDGQLEYRSLSYQNVACPLKHNQSLINERSNHLKY